MRARLPPAAPVVPCRRSRQRAAGAMANEPRGKNARRREVDRRKIKVAVAVETSGEQKLARVAARRHRRLRGEGAVAVVREIARAGEDVEVAVAIEVGEMDA